MMVDTSFHTSTVTLFEIAANFLLLVIRSWRIRDRVLLERHIFGSMEVKNEEYNVPHFCQKQQKEREKLYMQQARKQRLAALKEQEASCVKYHSTLSSPSLWYLKAHYSR